MKISSLIFLAFSYTRAHSWKSFLMIIAFTMIMILPSGIQVIVDGFQDQMIARAKQTPFILGKKGSQLDLVLHGLYFSGNAPGTITMDHLREIQKSDLAVGYPILNLQTAKKIPVVGISLEYGSFRGLRLASGRNFSILGEAIVGASVAKQLDLSVGSKVVTDSDNVFNIAGSYPLKLNVSGVLHETGTADDDVIFVDIKTTWLLLGIGHGHQEIDQSTDPKLILNAEGNNKTVNAAVLPYTEITPDNAQNIHFHGNENTFPISALLIVPHDAKSQSILEGRYIGDNISAQLVKPHVEVQKLLNIVFQIKKFFSAQMWFVGFVTLLLIALVINLSLRLREKEMNTFFVMGCSKLSQFQLLSTEILIYLVISLSISSLTLIVLKWNQSVWTSWIIKGSF